MASTKCWCYLCESGVRSNGTGPTSRQLQDKVGGVTPAGLLLIELHVAGSVIVSRTWLQRVRHEKHRRSPTPVLAREPARVQYSGCGYDRKPGSIQPGRSCPHPTGLRSRPVPRQLGVTTLLSEHTNAQNMKTAQRQILCICHGAPSQY
jgi:hypothetical protein